MPGNFRLVSSVVADSSGRVSLAKAGVAVADRYTVSVAEDGSVFLRRIRNGAARKQRTQLQSGDR